MKVAVISEDRTSVCCGGGLEGIGLFLAERLCGVERFSTPGSGQILGGVEGTCRFNTVKVWVQNISLVVVVREQARSVTFDKEAI